MRWRVNAVSGCNGTAKLLVENNPTKYSHKRMRRSKIFASLVVTTPKPVDTSATKDNHVSSAHSQSATNSYCSKHAAILGRSDFAIVSRRNQMQRPQQTPPGSKPLRRSYCETPQTPARRLPRLASAASARYASPASGRFATVHGRRPLRAMAKSVSIWPRPNCCRIAAADESTAAMPRPAVAGPRPARTTAMAPAAMPAVRQAP